MNRLRAIMSSTARPVTSTPPMATRLCLAQLRPGTPKIVSSAEKSEAKIRREVQTRRKRPGMRKRSACSTKPRSSSRDFLSMWMTTPRMRYSVPW